MTITVTGLRAQMSALRVNMGVRKFDFEIRKGYSKQIQKNELLYNKFVPHYLNRIIVPPSMTCVNKETQTVVKVEMCENFGVYKVTMGGLSFESCCPVETASMIRERL